MNLGYTVPARLYPVWLTCLPVGLAVVAWFPDKFVGYGFLTALLTWTGFSYLMSQFGRDLGRRKQPILWDAWGGKPTTQLLRHRNTDLDQHTHRRYHAKLSKIVPGISIPSAEEEARDPAAADEVYDSCANFLTQRTRNTKRYALLFKENVNYGFRRNLWGMKPAGLSLALVGLIASAVPAALSLASELRIVAALATALNACILVWWIFRINPDWVRVPAFAYANELLAACETIPDPPNTTDTSEKRSSS